MNDLEAIRDLINQRVDALNRRDAKAANAALDSAIVAFEVAGPLQLPPDQATNAALTQAWLDSFEQGPAITIHELHIHAHGDVAFCHGLNRIEGRRANGQQVDVTMRSTLGLRKREGEWKIVHGHTSLPR